MALAPTNPQTSNGLLLRELSFGPKDLVSFDQANNVGQPQYMEGVREARYLMALGTR